MKPACKTGPQRQRGIAALTAMLVVTIATLLAAELVWDLNLNVRRTESLLLREGEDAEPWEAFFADGLRRIRARQRHFRGAAKDERGLVGNAMQHYILVLAKRAKETGRSVALDPMNGRDRRALHVAVRDIEGVVTMSVGSGRYRQVVIVPEGAPEYEEAAAAAKEAEERD